MLDKEESHESYGYLTLYRVTSGRDTRFFGSDLTYGNYVELELTSGEVSHGLGGNWFTGGRKRIIKLRLTFAQWSEFVASFGTSGVPCTIESIGGRLIENPPVRENVKVLNEREVDKKLSNLFDLIEQTTQSLLANVAAKKSLGKKDQEELISDLDKIRRVLTTDLQFYKDQFKKETEKVVTEAKISIDSFLQNVLIQKGIEGFQANLSLQSPEKEEDAGHS